MSSRCPRLHSSQDGSGTPSLPGDVVLSSACRWLAGRSTRTRRSRPALPAHGPGLSPAKASGARSSGIGMTRCLPFSPAPGLLVRPAHCPRRDDPLPQALYGYPDIGGGCCLRECPARPRLPGRTALCRRAGGGYGVRPPSPVPARRVAAHAPLPAARVPSLLMSWKAAGQREKYTWHVPHRCTAVGLPRNLPDAAGQQRNPPSDSARHREAPADSRLLVICHEHGTTC
jgi:hypothetical protein